MSRIDEALRRAAGQTGGADVAAETPEFPPDAGGSVEALAHEPFPIELPGEAERRAARAGRAVLVPAPAPSGPSDAEGDREADPAAGAAPEGSGQRQRARGASLFERIDGRLSEKVVIDQRISPASREQYRRLAAVLHDAQGATGLRVLMVASAMAGEGKTLTASNLALTFSESYRRRVLLIDADLRRPTLHKVFHVESATGLVDDLANPGSKLVVRQLSPRLAMLPAGRPSADPMAALTSTRMQHLLEEARQTFDWVIIDTPPLGLLPDANLLASMMDGVVMVIRAGSTPHDIIKRSVESVGRSRVLGVVLNGAERPPVGGYGYEYGYGEDYYGGSGTEGLQVRS